MSARSAYRSTVVVLSHDGLAAIVANAPNGFGEQPDKYRYDVIFLKESLTAKLVMKDVTVKEGVDEVVAGKGVLYFSRLTSRATQSRAYRVFSLPIYKRMTIRNWNTTTKLLALLDQRGS